MILNYGKIAKALIEAGASVHAPDGHEMTPLHRACCFDRESVAELLLDSGAHVNTISEDGATPLSSAAYTANASLIKPLIERGASVIMACQNLIREVAPPISSDDSKISLVENFLKCDHTQTQVDELRRCGTAVYAAYENGDEDLVRFLIEYGSKISQTNQSDIDSSQNAGIEIQSKILKLLIDAGPDLDIPDDALTDALETALCGGHASLARKLLAKGANQDVNPRYAVQLEEVLNGKNMLTEMEPGNIEPYSWLSLWTHSTNETRRALFPPWILAMTVSCRCHGSCRKRSL